MVRSAHREAVGYLEQALRALSHLPETRDTREQAIDLRLALRTALTPLGDVGRTLTYLREAEALAAALDDPRRLGRVSDFLSFHYHFMGLHEQAITAAQRALALATTSGDGVLQAQANEHLGIASQAQGDYRRAIACFGQTVAFFDGTRHRERFGNVFLPAVLSRAYLAWCHAELGAFAEGRTCGEEGLQIAEVVAHPGSLVRAYWGLGLLALRQGDLSMALPRLERAVGLCQDADLPNLVRQDGCAFRRGLYAGWARRRGCAPAHAGDGTGNCHGKIGRPECLSSPPRQGATAGRPSGGSAAPRASAFETGVGFPVR